MDRTIETLITRYRTRGILVDTNLLLLYLVGNCDRSLIGRFKRTRSVYTPDDFDMLKLFVEQFPKLIATPNVLTEVSNLAGQLGELARASVFLAFSRVIELLDEHYVASHSIAKEPLFPVLGLTDLGIAEVVRGNYLVLTDDLRAASLLSSLEVDVLNFNHIRTLDW